MSYFLYLQKVTNDLSIQAQKSTTPDILTSNKSVNDKTFDSGIGLGISDCKNTGHNDHHKNQENTKHMTLDNTSKYQKNLDQHSKFKDNIKNLNLDNSYNQGKWNI